MRPTLEFTLMKICGALAERALCRERQVGCVLTDSSGRIVGTGYNGKAKGQANCSGSNVCAGECEGLHAEVNALRLVPPGLNVDACHVSVSPCTACTKALLGTPCRVIFTPMDQPLTDDQLRAIKLWHTSGRAYVEIGHD